MRKADYQTLATIIKDGRAASKANQDHFPMGSPNAEYWRGEFVKAGDIAFKFAERASVDKAAFLKACGIE